MCLSLINAFLLFYEIDHKPYKNPGENPYLHGAYGLGNLDKKIRQNKSLRLLSSVCE
jgi:hypothetical protein